MPKLYVTYESSELGSHGLELCNEASARGWTVTDGPRSVIPSQRESEAASHDALMLLSAWKYGYPKGQAPHELEWDAALRAGKPARAVMIDERAPWWPEIAFEGRNSPGLQAFREKIRLLAAPKGFGFAPDSVREIARPELDLLLTEVKRKQVVKVFVVWDFSIPGLDLVLSSVDRRQPQGFDVFIPGLKNRSSAGEIFRTIVVPEIRARDRVLVVTDRPNANVAFEAGIALGFGKQVSLVYFGVLPGWLDKSGLRGHIVNQVSGADAVREAIQNPNFWYTPKPVEPAPDYGTTLFLSGQNYIGATLREEQRAVDPTWLAPGTPVAVEDLHKSFRHVARVVWSIASYPEGTDTRDGAENSANALVAGWFYARAFAGFGENAVDRLIVFKERTSRVVLDVLPVVRDFGTLAEFAELLGTVPDGLPKPAPLEISGKGPVQYKMALMHQCENKPGVVWMGVTPVRVREYRAFCKATRRAEPDYFGDSALDEDTPVVRVSAADALAFCEWLSPHAVLPDPELWRYCALAGNTQHKYWWGDDDSPLEKVAWYSNNSGDPPALQKAGRQRANPWGLKDVFGNVWEWTAPFKDKVERPTSLGESVEIERATIMGGAFNTAPGAIKERDCDADLKEDNIGFRVALKE
jgi:hypothetical protein